MLSIVGCGWSISGEVVESNSTTVFQVVFCPIFSTNKMTTTWGKVGEVVISCPVYGVGFWLQRSHGRSRKRGNPGCMQTSFGDSGTGTPIKGLGA